MRRLPIGIDDFKRVIEEDYYYVDKTELISSIIDTGALVYLFPRPRRFGKTLNLMMLRCFFEKTKEDNSKLFVNLKIWEQEKYRAYQGKYPIIYLTLKDLKYSTWESTYSALKDEIGREYGRHDYILNSDILKISEKEAYNKIINKTAEDSLYASSLKDLSEYLTRYYGEKAIILMDEYDVIIQSGYMNKFYDQAVEFMRNWLSAGLKNNLNLQFGVLTGILKVSKESIFSGLNNVKVYSILNKEYDEYYGLLEEEVIEGLKEYNLEKKQEEVRTWYNGYKFGEKQIYNPWSIVNYLGDKPDRPEPYWINTSGNEMIKKLLLEGNRGIKQELEILLNGETIEKEITDNIVFADIEKDSNSLWNFLLFSGYLKTEEIKENNIYTLKIPNKEVEEFYKAIIKTIFTENLDSIDIREMIEAILIGEEEHFEEILNKLLIKQTSYLDSSESFYHGYVLGLLGNIGKEYQIKSNKESGYGRYDVMIIPEDKNKTGVVIEFKVLKKEKDLEEACNNALKQIEEKQYEKNLNEMGIKTVIKYGIAFEGKKCKVKKGEN